MQTFLIKIPANNRKTAKAFWQLLNNLHDTLGKGKVSFEILVRAQHISFCFTSAEKDVSLISGQIYSIFPDCEIMKIPDPLTQVPKNYLGGNIFLEKSDLFPIKDFKNFEGDSLAGLLSVLSKAALDEVVLIQYIIKPRQDTGGLHFMRNWKKRFDRIRYIFRIKYWFKKGNFWQKFKKSFLQKEEENLFEISMRFSVFSTYQETLRNRFHAIAQAFSQYNLTDFNNFVVKSPQKSSLFLNSFKKRTLGKPFLLSQSELTTIFHLPNEREVPNLVYVLSKKSDPPSSLATDLKNDKISFFGETNFHNTRIPFGIMRKDRRRHLYTVGKSGSGKSKFLELLIKNDFETGQGVGILDPHGDLVDNVLRIIPKERIDDVVIFDPSDEAYPIAFNPLEEVPSALKMRVTIGFLEIFKKLFGSNWTDRLEHVLRYTVLALLDSPNTTVLSIMKMLTDKSYRQYIIKNIEDDVVKNFWVNEFAGWSEKFDAEAITPLLNKVGQFVATNMIRNIVGQPQNKINFREIMDNKKILLMKVSKGILGEENAGLMGAFAITKIYQAAMSRADILEEDRQDFYFYVDEFQNFATNTFDEILSEARKYHLNITLANQFLGQLSDKIKTTVFGNVGSMVTFRVGAEDSSVFAGEYAPIFESQDIINLGVREFYTKMSINGETTQPFSGRTLEMQFPKENYSQEILNASREKYCLSIDEVKQILNAWEENTLNSKNSEKKEKNSQFKEPNFEMPIL